MQAMAEQEETRAVRPLQGKQRDDVSDRMRR